MPLIAAIKGRRGPSGFGYASTAEEVTEGLDLSGKTILITGVNSGLGYESARVLSLRGAKIIAVARSLEKATTAGDSFAGEYIPVACELSEPASVKAAVKTLVDRGERIDAIMCNAGIMALPKLQTHLGYELQFLTNHIGHFILVTGLLDLLTDAGRVVMLSSYGHNMAPKDGIQFDNLDGAKGYNNWKNYGQAKLANLLCAKALAKRFEGSSRVAMSVHPGVINTNLGRHMNVAMRATFPLIRPFTKSAAQGAATQCYAAVHPDAASLNGKYLANSNSHKTSKHGADDALAERLWTVSEEIVAKLT